GLAKLQVVRFARVLQRSRFNPSPKIGHNLKAICHLARYAEYCIFADREGKLVEGAQPSPWFNELCDKALEATENQRRELGGSESV
ncbi:hypothetical protein ABTN43_19660, partial [Acinetobacter baumannii]